MHLASIINKLTFVVEALFGELGDFFGVSGVEDDGVPVIVFGHDLQGIVAKGQEVTLAAPPH